jgi:chromosome partitioning protein
MFRCEKLFTVGVAVYGYLQEANVRTSAVTNLKGGTGKTTVAVNLGAALVRQGKRVLIIDLDGQQNAAEALGLEQGDDALFDIFNGKKTPLASLVEQTKMPNLELIRGSDTLYKVDRVCGGEPGADQVFARAFAGLPDRWDEVIIDLPPNRGLLTYSGLSVAQVALVVVSAQYLPLKQTAKVVSLLERVQETLNPRLSEIRYVVNQVDTRIRSSLEAEATLRKHLGEAVFDTAIRLNCRISESPGHAMPVIQYDSRSNGALDFLALAKEFCGKTRGKTVHKAEGGHATA